VRELALLSCRTMVKQLHAVCCQSFSCAHLSFSAGAA
jgi:hypothetical protein